MRVLIYHFELKTKKSEDMNKYVILVLVASFFYVSTVFAQQKMDENKPPYYLTDVELDKKLGIDEKKEAPKEYVWVIYFHRVPGCDTCQLMSKYVFETFKERFGDETKGKQIVLRYKNFEDRKNLDLVRKLKIQSPLLAIIFVKDGKMVKAKFATKIWSLTTEKEKFMEYVEKEIKVYSDELKEKKQ